MLCFAGPITIPDDMWKMGNIAGIALIVFSIILSNTEEESRIWQRTLGFYCGVAMPCTLGLLATIVISAALLNEKPDIV